MDFCLLGSGKLKMLSKSPKSLQDITNNLLCTNSLKWVEEHSVDDSGDKGETSLDQEAYEEEVGLCHCP